jgi:hypothetical protein
MLRALHDTTREFVSAPDAVWTTDLAMTSRYWVPLRDPTSAAAKKRDRLDPFVTRANARGWICANEQVRRDFTGVLMEIEEVALQFVLNRVDKGVPAFVEMWNDLGGHEWRCRKMTWLTDNQSRIDDALIA